MRPLTIVVQLLAIALLLPTTLWAQPPPRPILMAHYMPWFQSKSYGATWGWHWTMNHYNPDTFDGQGRRNIASHFYPLIGPYDSRDPDLAEYHALTMKVAGIDGAIVDWNGSSSLYDYPQINSGTLKLFSALSAAGLRFAVCYEDQSITQLINNGRITAAQAVAQGQLDMTYVRDHWANQPTYLTLDGKPVVTVFGPQYFYNEADWASILSVFSSGAQFFTLDYRLGTVAAGAFPWPPMWLSGGGVLAPEAVGQYLDSFYANAATWPQAVGGVFPGFHDIYQQAGVGPSYGYLDARNGLTFTETLDRALVANPQIIQVVTWNDFGEGTNIEPTQEYGYQYLEQVQDVARSFGAFPYAAGDLSLPYTLYGLRKQHHEEPTVMAQLKLAAGLIVAGQPAMARAILDAIQNPTAVEPGSLPVPNLAVQVRPNPAVMSATVLFDLPASGTMHLDVFDASGRRVTSLAAGHQAAGRHSFVWDARSHPIGVYLVRLQVGDEIVTRKMLVQR